MKKLIAGIALATIIGTAQATPVITQGNMTTSSHRNEYSVGYSRGKSDAYNNTARTLFIVGAVVIAGVVIYQLGQDSRWGFNDEGQVIYRF